MKKWISLLLAVVLMLSVLPVYAENEIAEFDDDYFWEFGDDDFLDFDDDSLDFGDDESMDFTDFEDDAETVELVLYDYDDITVGNPTPLNGQFFTDLWGNDTSDTDVRHLVAGYNLIQWDSLNSFFKFDRSVVSGALISDDKDGNRSYLLTLYSDLYYSDGTNINAWDYAFSVLFQCSPVIRELGGSPASCSYLVGYEDFAAGKVPYISGLRVLADNIIIFTVKSEALPYFYELSRLAFYPYPIHAIAPGYRVYDDGNGAYIDSAEKGETLSPLSADLLRETILAPDTGYMSHPNPVSGPYCLLSYDGNAAVFEINPYYKGNEEGRKPRIKRLTYTVADNKTMIEELGNGTFALLNKVAKASSIAEGLSLCIEKPQYTRSTYPRIGLTYVYFNPESKVLQKQKVRQAIAYCFDRPGFISDYVGAFGLGIDGLYGLGQWMYGAVTGTIPYPIQLPENATKEEQADYEKDMAAWDELSLDGLTRYELDMEQAVRLLNEAGWTLNEQGKPFDPSADAVRCKMIDGELIRLELTIGYQVLADIEQVFMTSLIDNLAQVGIRLTPVSLDFDSIVEAHNERQFESLDLMYFGDNFNISFDPAPFFHGDEQVEEDSLYAAYLELFALSEDMDHTEPTDILGYMEKWIRFQERLSELLPLIPVYTNIYFDFYTKELDEYYIEEHVSWAKAIVPARMHRIRSVDEDIASIEIELSYIDGEGEMDLSSLLEVPTHETIDYTNGALALFPKYVRDQIPDGFSTIYEFVAAKLAEDTDAVDIDFEDFDFEDIDADDIDEEADSIVMEYAFLTPYAEGETVYLLFGLPGNGSDVDWFVKEGVGLQNGNIQVEIEKELMEKLAGITFALAVVSRSSI